MPKKLLLVPLALAVVLVPGLGASAETSQPAPTQVVKADTTGGAVAADTTQPVPGIAAAFTKDDAKAQLPAIEERIAQLQAAQAAQNATPEKSDYSAEIKDLLKTAMELKDLVAAIASGNVAAFDPATIKQRIELTLAIGNAIHVATTQLTNKIEQTHVELGLTCAKAVLRLINLTNSAQTLQGTIDELNATLKRVSGYRDLQDGDRATIYVKMKLDRAILQTRLDRDKNVLGKAPYKDYAALNTQITHAVGVRAIMGATVGQVRDEVLNLDAGYKKALAAARG